jgi:hypothetical protein
LVVTDRLLALTAGITDTKGNFAEEIVDTAI